MSNIEVLKSQVKETGGKLSELREQNAKPTAEMYNLERKARKQVTQIELEQLKTSLDI